jgi:drug/metabolite transporter (DMT)-like permease
MARGALRRPRRRRAELVGLLLGALAGWLLVGLAWPQAALAGDALWLLGVVAGGLAGLLSQGLWRYGAVLARRRRRGEW